MKHIPLNSPEDCKSYQRENNITLAKCKEYCVCGAKFHEVFISEYNTHNPDSEPFPIEKESVITIIKQWSSDLVSTQTDKAAISADEIKKFLLDVYWSGKNIGKGYDHCLNMKAYFIDLVKGCDSNLIDYYKDNDDGYVHCHQRKPYYIHFGKDKVRGSESFEKFAESIREQHNKLASLSSFKELIEQLKELADNDRILLPGIGPLVIYDTAIRFARQSGAWERLKPQKVHLHAGVAKGAESLWHLNRLIGLDWFISSEKDGKWTQKKNYSEYDKECFSFDLESYHLENFLCWMHTYFLLLENAVRIHLNKGIRLGSLKYNPKPGVKPKKSHIFFQNEKELYDCLKPEGYPPYDEWLQGQKEVK